MTSEVVITGLGAVSPYGLGADVLWAAIAEGRTAFTSAPPASESLPALPPVLSAAVRGISLSEVLGKKGLRAVNPESQLFLAASVLAMREAALPSGADPTDLGVFAGTTRAGLDDYVKFHVERLVWGPARVSPTRGPNTGFNAPASHAAIRLGLQGANITVSSRTAASLDAIAHAADFVRLGRAKVMVAGGIETFSYVAARALLDEGRAPDGPPRPYDVRRSLPVPGEGAVVFVLETRAHAEARGAKVLAEVGAWSMAYEPVTRGASLSRASTRSASGALAREGAKVEAVFSSAPGDRTLDAAEAVGLAEVVSGSTPVCAVKGACGEWEGASAAVQALAAVRALGAGLVPPTAGFEEADPALPSLSVSNLARSVDLGRVLVHVLDPSGRSSSLVLRKAGS